MVAVGVPIDQPGVYLYRQSAIPAHSELCWILANFTGFGELSRMVEFKQKSQQVGQDRISLGLFGYPVLMAADILLYGARWVPVGDDQRQHLEFTRDLAQRFNQQFDGDVFQIPATVTEQQQFLGQTEPIRIRSLKDPTAKMSKSEQDPAGTIGLTDSPGQVASKIKAAATDAVGKINYDWEQQPAISNFLTILAHLTDQDLENTIADWQGQTSYRALKDQLAAVINQTLASIQTKLNQVSDGEIEAHLTRSESHLRTVASNQLADVQRLIGLRGPN